MQILDLKFSIHSNEGPTLDFTPERAITILERKLFLSCQTRILLAAENKTLRDENQALKKKLMETTA